MRKIQISSSREIEVMDAKLRETGEPGVVMFDDAGATFLVGEISMTQAEAGDQLARRQRELLLSRQAPDAREALRIAMRDLPAAARRYTGAD